MFFFNSGSESAEFTRAFFWFSFLLDKQKKRNDFRRYLENGNELDVMPGDAINIPPRHDGWVVGNEPAVFISFE